MEGKQRWWKGRQKRWKGREGSKGRGRGKGKLRNVEQIEEPKGVKVGKMEWGDGSIGY